MRFIQGAATGRAVSSTANILANDIKMLEASKKYNILLLSLNIQTTSSRPLFHGYA